MQQIGVLLVDDHAVVRHGLRLILEQESDIRVLGEAKNGSEALELVRELTPDVVVMDIGLPEMSGIEATRRIKDKLPKTRIVALSMYSADEYVLAMLKAGADAYLVKESIAIELVNAVRAVFKGESALCHTITRKLIANITGATSSTDRPEALSDRESQILHLMATGATSKEIAAKLHLSAKTVDNHRSTIIEKLQARNKVEAIVRAIRQGLIPIMDPARPS